jgi:hypothetical protein
MGIYSPFNTLFTLKSEALDQIFSVSLCDNN